MVWKLGEIRGGGAVRVGELERLCASVLAVSRAPGDELEVGAALESLGWTDQQVAQRFRMGNVFALATEIWPAVRTRAAAQLPARARAGPRLGTLAGDARSFLKGTIFAAPMVISIFAMLILRYSLWAYQYLTTERATAIALAMVLSFLATGGFTQAIARRGLMYVVQSEYGMARRMTFLLARIGALVSAVLAAGLFLTGMVFPLFPPAMTLSIVSHFLLLCAMWLSLTIFYMLRAEVLFTVLVGAGTWLTWALHERFHVPITTAQGVALGATSAAGILLAAILFAREERRKGSRGSPRMPRMSIVAYTVAPYFAYGFLFFLFLYLDRLMAWSAHSAFMPYVIWFRGDYELGLDWAMMGLVLPLGVIEVLISRFSARLSDLQKEYTCARIRLFNSRQYRAYRGSLLLCCAAAAAGMLVPPVLLDIAHRLLPGGAGCALDPVSVFTLCTASIAYALLAPCMLNCLVLFSLSVPGPAVAGMVAGLIVNCLVGFLLTRLWHYALATCGLIAGVIVFLFFTTRACKRVLSRMDYHLYAAA